VGGLYFESTFSRLTVASHPMTNPHSAQRRTIAQRVADAHGAPLAFVSGSVVDELADERSDVDMSVVFDALPEREALLEACRRAGASDWSWHAGNLADGGLVVACRIDGIEVQIGYSDAKTLDAHLDELLVEHKADTPTHKLGEGILKAEALAGAQRLAALKARLARFPPELGRAMIEHFLRQGAPWRAVSQLLHRDGDLWCRELLVDACYGLFGVLAGLNQRYFTTFQFKRMTRFADGFALAPADLAARIQQLLLAPPRAAFAQLHGLEGEVLDLLAAHAPATDLSAVRRRRADFQPD
jgi:hypothetical protein